VSKRPPFSAAAGYPDGGLALTVEYRTGARGTRSSYLHLPAILPVIRAALGCRDVFSGSLNFSAPAAVTFPGPARLSCAGAEWLFVGAVIEESAIGLAARRPPPEVTEIIEVFACEQLAPRLGLRDGVTAKIRLLPAVQFTTVLQEACVDGGQGQS
jgi:hypothetical protein